MGNFLKDNRVFILVVVVLIGVVGFLLLNKTERGTNQIQNTQVNRLTGSNDASNQDVLPTDEPTPTSKPVSDNPNSTNTEQAHDTSTTVSGGPQGHVFCNYDTPVGPTTYGTATIKATWNNLTIGKSGRGQADICVSDNSTPALMSQNNSANGTRSTTVTWLAPNGDYNFLIYDDHGGDFSACTGVVLYSCRIPTTLPITPTPGGPKQEH